MIDSLLNVETVAAKMINNSLAFSGCLFAIKCPYANKEAATFNVALTSIYLIL